jgi:hypothetical protein
MVLLDWGSMMGEFRVLVLVLVMVVPLVQLVKFLLEVLPEPSLLQEDLIFFEDFPIKSCNVL